MANGLTVEVRGLTKRFGDRAVLSELDLEIAAGEFVALLGRSGCGKSTLLRILAGLDTEVDGDATVRGAVSVAFQQPLLLPWRRVWRNVVLGLRQDGRTRSRDRALADRALAEVRLADHAQSWPRTLSGGEAQRLSLARALVREPGLLLLDEPFAALDASLREALRQEVVGILRAAGTSALLVTHDQAEALSLADTLAVMRAGRLEQVGTPDEVYQRPRTRWVAEFLGDADVLPGTAHDGVVDCELGRFGVAAELSGRVELVVRPESVAIGQVAAAGASATHARVVARSFYGHDQLVQLELPSGLRLRSRRLGFPAWHPGDHVSVWVDGPVTAVRDQPPAGGTAR